MSKKKRKPEDEFVEVDISFTFDELVKRENPKISMVVDTFKGDKSSLNQADVIIWLKDQSNTARMNILEQCLLKMKEPILPNNVDQIFINSTVHPDDKQTLAESSEKFSKALVALKNDVDRLNQEIGRHKSKHHKDHEEGYPEKIRYAIKKRDALIDVIDDINKVDRIEDLTDILNRASKNSDIIKNRPTSFTKARIKPGPKWFQKFRGKTDPSTGKKSESTTHNHLITLRTVLTDMKNALKDTKEHIEEQKADRSSGIM